LLSLGSSVVPFFAPPSPSATCVRQTKACRAMCQRKFPRTGNIVPLWSGGHSHDSKGGRITNGDGVRWRIAQNYLEIEKSKFLEGWTEGVFPVTPSASSPFATPQATAWQTRGLKMGFEEIWPQWMCGSIQPDHPPPTPKFGGGLGLNSATLGLVTGGVLMDFF